MTALQMPCCGCTQAEQVWQQELAAAVAAQQAAQAVQERRSLQAEQLLQANVRLSAELQSAQVSTAIAVALPFVCMSM